uniref:Tyrosinase copper-binding domain-containing protein n=1 Tax=Globodera rostochiensis TaxID=31243 RepID=A0A914HFV1_GLORO
MFGSLLIFSVYTSILELFPSCRHELRLRPSVFPFPMRSAARLISFSPPFLCILLPFLLISLSLTADHPSADRFCMNLPHSNYLSADDLRRVCQHRAQWIRDQIQGDPGFSVTEMQRDYLNSLEASRRVPFLSDEWGESANAKRAGKKGPTEERNDLRMRKKRQWESSKVEKTRKSPQGRKFVRKEYRLMSDGERAHLHEALNTLKTKRIDNITIWDLHILLHYPNSAPAAHWGPAFLPWHREFLRQFEAALQSEVPELVGIPYWDSTLDHGLPDSADSVLWSQELMGNANGFVKSGPFKDWDTNVLMPLSPVPIKRLYRSAGARSQDRLLSSQDAEWIVSRNNFSELTFCHDKTFESMHGLSHVWVGGFMFVIRVSPNDPTFYFHHAFIDFLWEQFRQKSQSRKQRERDYAEKICNKSHGLNAQMKPFKLKNKDGLSNDYTDFWVDYEAVRHCTSDRPTCDSRFLFCDRTAWRCRSRVVLGGNCTGFAGTEICYGSVCIQNVCRLPATEGNGFLRRERRPASAVVWAKSWLLEEGGKPTSSGIAHVAVREESARDEPRSAFVPRHSHYPELPGVMYLPLPNPKDGILTANVSLEANDHYGRYCQSYCMNSTTTKYQVCEPRLALHNRLISAGGAVQSANISFTHQFGARRFLDMDLSVHPRKWKVHLPFIVFNCHKRLLNSTKLADIADQHVLPVDQSEYVWFRVSLLRKFRSTTELDDLQLEAEDVDDPSELFISSVRRARSAYDHSVVFVRARSPWLRPQGVSVRVSLRQNGLRVDCDARCTFENQMQEEHCEPVVKLHVDPELSQEQIFTPDMAYLPYIGWRMVGHPSEWRLQMAFLSLYC